MILFKSRPEPVLSPCIGVCTLDDRGHCMGCYRTAEEIEQWLEMDDEARQGVLDRLAERSGG